jgi:hypothetical protein
MIETIKKYVTQHGHTPTVSELARLEDVYSAIVDVYKKEGRFATVSELTRITKYKNRETIRTSIKALQKIKILKEVKRPPQGLYEFSDELID